MPDVFANIGAASEEMLGVIADVLEMRAAIPSQRDMLQDYLSQIDFPVAARVLEVGCGTGAVCRAVAALGPVETVVGVDPSPVLIAKARELSDDFIEFEEGDGRALRFADESFDVVILHTLLTHVPEPDTILKESRRVLKQGGTLGLCDGDFATATLGTGDFDPLEACTQAFVANFVHDRWFLRKMPAQVQGAGFEVGPLRSYGLVETLSPGLTMSWVDRGADALAGEGRIGPDLAAALKDEGRRRAEAGTFFGYMAYAAMIARKR